MYATIPAWNTILSTWSNPTSPSGLRGFFWLCWVFVAAQAFSSRGFSCGAQVLGHLGFHSCGAQA